MVFESSLPLTNDHVLLPDQALTVCAICWDVAPQKLWLGRGDSRLARLVCLGKVKLR